MTTNAPPIDGPPTVEESVAHWQRADARMRTLYRSLADAPNEPPDAWAVLLRTRTERDEAITQMGQAFAAWFHGGGEIELVEPALSTVSVARPAASSAPPTPAIATPPEPQTASVPDPPPPAPEPTPEVVAPEPTSSEVVAPEPKAEVAAPEPPAEVVAPEPPPRRPPVPKGPPASPEALLKLQALGVGGAVVPAADAKQARARAHFDVLLKTVRQPLEPHQLTELMQWVSYIDHINRLAEHDLVCGVEALVCRLRSLQQRCHDPRCRQVFPTLTRWSNQRKPGSIHGLKLDDTHRRASWDDDAQAALERRVAPAAPATPVARPSAEKALEALAPQAIAHLDAAQLRMTVATVLDAGVAFDDPRLLKSLADRYAHLKGDKRMAPVRKAIQKMNKRARRGSASIAGEPPKEWPFWHLTENKRGAVVGGDFRANNRDRIKAAFHFAHVDWIDPKKPNARERIAEKVKSGTIDVIIINHFGSHAVDREILPIVGGDLSRWVRAEHGYGVDAIRRSMEKHWAALAVETDPGASGP